MRPEVTRLRVLEECRLDANPLKSPPLEVRGGTCMCVACLWTVLTPLFAPQPNHTQMIHRLDDLMNYCHLRELNIKDFLVAAGFHQVQQR